MMCAQIYGRLCRSFLLLALLLTPGVAVPSACAFQVADGMALLLQEMPANYCALTFDDGPGPYTSALLDLLAQRGIAATFFVLGQNAERRPALIRRMLAEGHEVASHSYSHADMRRLKPEDQSLEMQRSTDVLRALGADVRYFRPPYGRYTPETAELAEALGMTIMLWSLDSQDWKRHVSRSGGLRSVSPSLQQTFPGLRGVFLFHDTHKRTVDEMARMLDVLTASGCDRFVTVSEYMAHAPREEERRLSTHAPNEGRGETPLPSLAGRLPGSAADSVLPQPPEDMRDQRLLIENMRTQAAHDVKAPQVRDGQSPPAPFSLMRAMPSATPRARASAAAQGQSRGMLILPAPKPNIGRQDIRKEKIGPG